MEIDDHCQTQLLKLAFALSISNPPLSRLYAKEALQNFHNDNRHQSFIEKYCRRCYSIFVPSVNCTVKEEFNRKNLQSSQCIWVNTAPSESTIIYKCFHCDGLTCIPGKKLNVKKRKKITVTSESMFQKKQSTNLMVMSSSDRFEKIHNPSSTQRTTTTAGYSHPPKKKKTLKDSLKELGLL